MRLGSPWTCGVSFRPGLRRRPLVEEQEGPKPRPSCRRVPWRRREPEERKEPKALRRSNCLWNSPDLEELAAGALGDDGEPAGAPMTPVDEGSTPEPLSPEDEVETGSPPPPAATSPAEPPGDPPACARIRADLGQGRAWDEDEDEDEVAERPSTPDDATRRRVPVSISPRPHVPAVLPEEPRRPEALELGDEAEPEPPEDPGLPLAPAPPDLDASVPEVPEVPEAPEVPEVPETPDKDDVLGSDLGTAPTCATPPGAHAGLEARDDASWSTTSREGDWSQVPCATTCGGFELGDLETSTTDPPERPFAGPAEPQAAFCRTWPTGDFSKRVLDGWDQPVGLRNLGNTCFLSAAVQALSHCPVLALYFLHGAFVADLNAANPLGSGGRVAAAYAALLQRLWAKDPDQQARQALSPQMLTDALRGPQFAFAGTQEDAHEFLATLLDGLHEDLHRGLFPRKKEKPPEDEDKSTTAGSEDSEEGKRRKEALKKGKDREDRDRMLRPSVQPSEQWLQREERIAAEAWHAHLTRNRSVLVDLLQGQLRSQLTCPACAAVSVTFDPFMNLSLPVPEGRAKAKKGFGMKLGGKANAEVSVRDALDAFCAEEQLDADNLWRCPSCKKEVRATKKIDLWKVPSILVLHLKRFAFKADGTASKVDRTVQCPMEGLDLSRLLTSPQTSAPMYDLVATVDHHGSTLHCGHYTATCRRPNGEWCRFDDEEVTPLGDFQASGANYVWFFLRRSTPLEPAAVPQQSPIHPEAWPHVPSDRLIEWSFLREPSAPA